jgi:hypothetical protein
MATEQGPPALDQTTPTGERIESDKGGDAAKADRTDWKKMYLTETKPALEEKNKLASRIAELEQERNRPPTVPPAAVDPRAQERQQLEYLASIGDLAAKRTLEIEREFAREIALTRAEMLITRYPDSDQAGIREAVMSGNYANVEAAANGYYGQKYRSNQSEQEKQRQAEAARKRAEEEARQAAEKAPGTATPAAPAAARPSGPLPFSKWSAELAQARDAGNSARVKELLDLASRKQISEG